jgi:hypothetical protein
MHYLTALNEFIRADGMIALTVPHHMDYMRFKHKADDG